MAERPLYMRIVVGSSPSTPTMRVWYSGIISRFQREDVGSIPITRSKAYSSVAERFPYKEEVVSPILTMPTTERGIVVLRAVWNRIMHVRFVPL